MTAAVASEANRHRPSQRKLRVFAFDPQASLSVDTAPINNALVALPWEQDWEDKLEKGPVNEYIEVVDYDPVSGCFYPPVDLNDPHLLAQDGLPPSDGNPQFHQQMVFAVAMKTIRAFERALGRPVFWMRENAQPIAPETADKAAGKPPEKAEAEGGNTARLRREYVRRLRIYPHALRGANAYYSPQKAALMFGYFRGKHSRDGTGGGWVFTCLSQDIVAHETTHAILHGMWPRSIEASNPDTLAFHEAFADIVALLQHFSAPHIVAHQLTRSGGCLRSKGLLTGLAQQFGHATGRDGPLRFALDMVIKEQELLEEGKTLAPDRNADVIQPHQRGQILVAAVFDTFVSIYDQRTADLFRLAGIARGSSGNLPHDLVARLTDEAVKTADQVLRMCIRGLDYLPPVDVMFGDYLRAIVTADTELVPDDPRHYRTAFAEAFRKRGIAIDTGHFSSPDSLMWDEPEPFPDPPAKRKKGKPAATSADASFSDVLAQLALSVTYGPVKLPKKLSAWHRKQIKEIAVFPGAKVYREEAMKQDDVQGRNLRDLAMYIVQINALIMHQWLTESDPNDANWSKLLGVQLGTEFAPKSVFANRWRPPRPRVEVHSVRIARRQGPDGQMLQQLIIQVTQRRRGFYDPKRQEEADAGKLNDREDFTFRGGATVIVDLNDGRVRRIIRKRIDDNKRLARHRGFLLGDMSVFTFAERPHPAADEPFAFMHGVARPDGC
jgi:hypothetical protein